MPWPVYFVLWPELSRVGEAFVEIEDQIPAKSATKVLHGVIPHALPADELARAQLPESDAALARQLQWTN